MHSQAAQHARQHCLDEPEPTNNHNGNRKKCTPISTDEMHTQEVTGHFFIKLSVLFYNTTLGINGIHMNKRERARGKRGRRRTTERRTVQTDARLQAYTPRGQGLIVLGHSTRLYRADNRQKDRIQPSFQNTVSKSSLRCWVSDPRTTMSRRRRLMKVCQHRSSSA